MSETKPPATPLTRQEEARVSQLANLLETNPHPGPSDLVALWGVSKQRAHQILRSLIRKGAVTDRGYEIPKPAVDFVTDDKSEKIGHPISPTPTQEPADMAATIVATSYGREGLEGRTENGRIIVTRKLTASLPKGAGSLGTVVHRLSRALLKVEVPQP